MADVQRTRNTQNEINQFDNMSIEDLDNAESMKPKGTPPKHIKNADRNNVEPYVSKPTKAEKKASKVSKVSAFRPVENLDKKTKFKADKKPSLTTEKPKKKVPVKALLAIASCVVVIVGVCVFVPPINKTISLTLKGASKYIQTCEDNAVEGYVTDIIGLANKFFKLTTDNAVKGKATIEVKPECAGVYVNPVLLGTYKGDYTYVTAGKIDNLAYDLSYEGRYLGTLNVTNNYDAKQIFVKPTMFTSAVQMDLQTYLEESENFGITYKEGVQKFLIDDYTGISVTSLFSSLSDEKLLKGIAEQYKSILQESNFKYSFDFNMSELPKGIKADTRVLGKASWADAKSTIDALVQTAKSDNSLIKIVSASGISQQSYLDILNDISAKLNAMYSGADDKAVITVETYLSKDAVVYRNISIPMSSNEKCVISITTTENIKELYVAEGSSPIFQAKLVLEDKSEGYTGKLTIGVDKPVVFEFTNLVLGDVMSGDLTVTRNMNTLTAEFKADSIPSVNLTYSSNGVEYVTADIEMTTYSVTDIKDNVSTGLALYSDKVNEKSISEFIAKSADYTDLLYYYKDVDGIDVDTDKLSENIGAILLGYSNKNYDIELPNEDISVVKVDEREVLENALAVANDNAYRIAFAANQFVSECADNPKNKYEIIDGVYTGTLAENKANFSYGTDFETKNLEACLSFSADPGYYCFVLKDSKVIYAFWSENEDFQPRVDKKELPSHFKDISTISEVKGSYPVASTLVEE